MFILSVKVASWNLYEHNEKYQKKTWLPLKVGISNLTKPFWKQLYVKIAAAKTYVLLFAYVRIHLNGWYVKTEFGNVFLLYLYILTYT